MGRKSTKENKNIYQTSQEQMGYTRDAAAEKLTFISADRIEKIEYEKSLPHPEEVLAMASCYKNPALCNYFCSHECPIGIEHVPEIKSKDPSQITPEILATLNKLTREKARLIEIAVDGKLPFCTVKSSPMLPYSPNLSTIKASCFSLIIWQYPFGFSI